MKQKLAMITGILCFAGMMYISCNEPGNENAAIDENDSKQSFTAEQVKRGEYLVGITGCNDCHTPFKMGPRGPERDLERALSGHPAAMTLPPIDSAAAKNYVQMAMTTTAFIGPWGTSYSANLTSDETGIGNWSLAQFKKALKEGKWKGMDNSRTLLPPMPWENFRNVTDEDIRDMFAYLKSTKPVQNITPASLPNAPMPQ